MINKSGFTLIELLVVVAIIGILAAIGLVTFSGFTDAAKANVVKSNHKTVVNFISASLGKCTIGDELKLKAWKHSRLAQGREVSRILLKIF
jgi:type IV pilus assembly protein PilA